MRGNYWAHYIVLPSKLRCLKVGGVNSVSGPTKRKDIDDSSNQHTSSEIRITLLCWKDVALPSPAIPRSGGCHKQQDVIVKDKHATL